MGSTGQLFLESATSLMCIRVYLSCRYLRVEDDFWIHFVTATALIY